MNLASAAWVWWVLVANAAMAAAARPINRIESRAGGEELGVQRRSATVTVQPYVIGGEIATEGRFPYMCSLRTNTHLHRCGCVLVDDWWILTAAHCVDPESSVSVGLNPVTYIGGWDIEQDENSAAEIEVVRPKKTFIHPAWNGTVQSGNDIALLQLQKASRHRPITFNPAKNQVHTGQLLVALGWGITEKGQISRYLRQAPDLSYISLKNCRKGFEGFALPDGVVCTYAEDQDTCQGDSGGPLIIADSRGDDLGKGSPSLDLLVGITSYGPNPCGADEFPGVSTNVAYFKEWIDDVMKKASAQSGRKNGKKKPKPTVISEASNEPEKIPIETQTHMEPKEESEDQDVAENVSEVIDASDAPISSSSAELLEGEGSNSESEVQTVSTSPVPAGHSTASAPVPRGREDIKFVTLNSSSPPSEDENVPETQPDRDSLDETSDSQEALTKVPALSPEAPSTPPKGPSDSYSSDVPESTVDNPEPGSPEGNIEVQDTTSSPSSWSFSTSYPSSGYSYSSPGDSNAPTVHTFPYSYTTSVTSRETSATASATSNSEQESNVGWVPSGGRIGSWRPGGGSTGSWRPGDVVRRTRSRVSDWIG